MPRMRSRPTADRLFETGAAVFGSRVIGVIMTGSDHDGTDGLRPIKAAGGLSVRGQAFRGGYHDFTIKTGGVAVFPRLVAAEHRTGFARSQMKSGVSELDALLGGGIERGSSTLILGPAGTGKSTYAFPTWRSHASGAKGLPFVFDKELGLLFQQGESHGLRP